MANKFDETGEYIIPKELPVQPGDKVIVKNKKNLPAPISENIKTAETELTVEEVHPNYVTLSYNTTKEFALENNGAKTAKVNMFRENMSVYFRKKK